MGTPAIQLRTLRKPVVTVHFNELNQLRKFLHCGVAVCLVKHLPAHRRLLFLKRSFLHACEEFGAFLFSLLSP